MARGLGGFAGPGKEKDRLRDYEGYVRADTFLGSCQSHGFDAYSVKKPLRNLLSFQSTTVKMVLCTSDFYLLVGLHLLLLAAFRAKGRALTADGKVDRLANGLPRTHWPRVSSEMFIILSPLLVFTLVFYNNQSYNRYIEQFFLARRMDSSVRYLTSRLRAFFRNDPFPGADNSMRAILRSVIVAHYCLYFRLPRYCGRKIDKWGFDYLLKCQLITEKEMEWLQHKSGQQIMGDTLAFCTELLAKHVQRGDIDTLTYGLFEEDLLRLAYYVMVITSYANNPLPFAYYHLTNLLTLGHMIMIAYSFVFLDSLMTIMTFPLLCIAVLGLRDLSSALADPFGADDTDFPTILPTAISHQANEALLDRDTIFGPAVILESTPCWKGGGGGGGGGEEEDEVDDGTDPGPDLYTAREAVSGLYTPLISLSRSCPAAPTEATAIAIRADSNR